MGKSDILRRIEESGISEFRKRTYRAVLEIPAGETVTYGELARRIGCGSARAVGQALRRNPFAPEVPCHRVVAAGGRLGGYFGQMEGKAVERKRRLIDEESPSRVKSPPVEEVMSRLRRGEECGCAAGDESLREVKSRRS